MKEKLIVISGDKRYNVDLPKDGGITLSYESNLFTSLSDINCNRTYTFTLPITTNNSRIFDMAEEVMHKSVSPYHRLKCEYYINDLLVITNANLYVESVKGAYNAVMTWNVVEGLLKIKDDDVDINTLYGDTVFDVTPIPLAHSNSSQKKDSYFDNLHTLRPYYSAGIDVGYAKANLKRYVGVGHKTTRSLFDLMYPLPVVPIPKIIKLIEDKYDLRIPIYTNRRTTSGETTTKADADRLANQSNWSTLNFIDLGCVPCVSTQVPRKIMDEHCSFTLYEPDIFVNLTLGSKEHILFWSPSRIQDPNDIIEYEYNSDRWFVKDKSHFTGFKPKYNRMSVNLSGRIFAAFANDVTEVSLEFTQFVNKNAANGFIGNNYEYYELELESAKGEYVDNPTDYGFKADENVFVFDYRKEVGSDITLENLVGDWHFIASLTKKPTNFRNERYDTTTVTAIFPEGAEYHPMNSVAALPSISCLTFLKSLFYAIGAFPVMNGNGNITFAQYSDIKKNMDDGISVDWSRKMLKSLNDENDIHFAVSAFAKTNKYKFKGDDDNENKQNSSRDDDKIEQFTYEKSNGTIETETINADEEKDVITLPFFGRYLKNNYVPDIPTGEKLKYWVKEVGGLKNWIRKVNPRRDRNGNIISGTEYGTRRETPTDYVDATSSISASEASPVIGMINFIPEGLIGTSSTYLGMEVWQGFKDMAETNENYKFLQELVRNPIVLKKEFLLDEFDLLNLDFVKPVYLSQYAAYFCIVKIERKPSGISEVELLKIPN